MYLMHDGTVDRTTDGHGHLMALTSAEIDQLDAGIWFSEEFVGLRVPRFDEYLRWIKGKAGLFLDIKFAHPQQLIDLLDEVGMKSDCFLWSGSNRWMILARTLDPDLTLKINVSTVDDVLRRTNSMVLASLKWVPANLSPALQEVCHELGIKVMAYQKENDIAAYRRILDARADMINLNHADAFLDVLAAYPASTS